MVFQVLLNFIEKNFGAQALSFGGLLGPAVRSALRATPPQFALRAGCRFFPKRKFYSIFSKKSRFPKAVRQRKFGFQPKLPGRKRPSSGVFSGFQPEARFARRPLSLPYGRGVGDPSPQAPPRWGKVRFLPVLYPKVSSTFSKVAGSRGRAPDALRTASRSEAFRAQPAEGGLLARDERGTLSPVKRILGVPGITRPLPAHTTHTASFLRTLPG